MKLDLHLTEPRMYSLSKIYLSKNLWKCDSLKFLLSYLADNNIDYEEYIEISNDSAMQNIGGISWTKIASLKNTISQLEKDISQLKAQHDQQINEQITRQHINKTKQAEYMQDAAEQISLFIIILAVFVIFIIALSMTVVWLVMLHCSYSRNTGRREEAESAVEVEQPHSEQEEPLYHYPALPGARRNNNWNLRGRASPPTNNFSPRSVIIQ